MYGTQHSTATVLFISVEYHRVANFAASGSNDSMSGKVTPFDISQETNEMRTRS
jgi:hypothetical protein